MIKKSNNKNTDLYKGLSLIVVALILHLKMNEDFQIYFYSNYILYSLVICILILIYYLLSQKKSIFSIYTFSFTTVVMSIFVWFIPKVLHYTVLTKHEVCLKSNITSKFWHRYGDHGIVHFTIDKNESTPIDLTDFNTLSQLSKFDYDAFPSKGNYVSICGQMSKVGFSYADIYEIR